MKYLINDLRDTLYTKYNKKQMSSDSSEALHEIQNIFAHCNLHLTNSPLEKTVNFLHYTDTWLQNENKLLSTNHYQYSRGDIITLVDFGTCNIGTEIRYPHPCVVLYDNGEDWVIVAPITAASYNKTTGKPIIHKFEVYAAKTNISTTSSKPSNLYRFKKDSVIQVDQIVRISKHRILNKKRFKLHETYLNQIDNLILEKYIPKKYALLETLKRVISTQKQELEQKDTEIDKLNKLILTQKEIINKKETEIAELNQQLLELKKVQNI